MNLDHVLKIIGRGIALITYFQFDHFLNLQALGYQKLETIFTRVGTFVQRGSKFCFVVLLVLVLVGTLVRILHFRPISPCFQLVSILQHCPAALPGSSALKYYKFNNRP
jgi:hypothetical protein